MLTETFWQAVNSIGLAIAAFYAWQLKRQSTATQTKIKDIHEKVNGQTEQRIREARQYAPQILIVEDNAFDVELMSTVLRKFGADIFEARNGAHAVELVRSRIGSDRGFPFDLALVDLRLAGGEDASNVVEKIEKFAPLLRMAIITGQPDGLLIQKVIQGRSLLVLDKGTFDETVVEKVLHQNNIPFTRTE